MQFVIPQTHASRIGRHFVHVSLCVASCALPGVARADDWPAMPVPALAQSGQQPAVAIPVALEDFDASAKPIDSEGVRAAPVAVADGHSSGQPGTHGGIVMIGAPALDTQPVSVTLWDEVVSPSQAPRPSDAARSAQDANVTYSKK